MASDEFTRTRTRTSIYVGSDKYHDDDDDAKPGGDINRHCTGTVYVTYRPSVWGEGGGARASVPISLHRSTDGWTDSTTRALQTCGRPRRARPNTTGNEQTVGDGIGAPNASNGSALPLCIQWELHKLLTGPRAPPRAKPLSGPLPYPACCSAF
jgi:hypothetical protein